MEKGIPHHPEMEPRTFDLLDQHLYPLGLGSFMIKFLKMQYIFGHQKFLNFVT